MQAVSQTYRNLLAAGAPKECRAIIAGVTYGQSKIQSAVVKSSLMNEAATVGNCVSKELNLTIRDPGDIPRMAQISMQFRLNDGTTHSEWLPKGVFFIDTRQLSASGVLLQIDAFDPMLKCDQPYMTSGQQGGWPKTDITVVRAIASRIGVTLDPRVTALMTKAYSVGYPGYGDGAYTMRDVLGFIGTMYCGNWIITDENKLMLVVLGDIPVETNYLVTENDDYIIIGGYRILV